LAPVKDEKEPFWGEREGPTAGELHHTVCHTRRGN